MYPSRWEGLGATIAPARSWKLTPGAIGKMLKTGTMLKPVVSPVKPVAQPRPIAVRPRQPILIAPVAPAKPAIPKPITEPVRRFGPLPLLCATGWVNVGGKCVRRTDAPLTPKVTPPKPKPKLPPPMRNGEIIDRPPAPKPKPAPPELSIVSPGGGGAAPGSSTTVSVTGAEATALPGWIMPVAIGAVALLLMGKR